MAKNGKVVSSLDGVNPQLQARLESAMNLGAEISVYEESVAMLKAGTISVRGLKATITACNENKGQLPTIKPSTAQYFLASSEVRSLAGGKDKPLRDILNATIQAKRAKKTDDKGKEVSMFADLLEGSKTFAEFVKATPSQGERAKAGRKTSAPVPVVDSVDAFVSFFLGATELTDFKVSNAEQWDKFINLVARISEYNRRNHPAIKSKATAKAS